MRKHFVLTLMLSCFFLLETSAQTFPGYRTGNYTGVNGVFFNPANIADNRFKWDVNLFAINGFVGTDQGGLKFGDITRSFNSDSLKSKLLKGHTQINSLDYIDVLGPSVMVSLGPGTSVAFTTRTRVFSNVMDVNGDLASAVINATNTGIIDPVALNGSHSVVHATGWTEIGGSIAQVFSQNESHHFFKGGITLKFIAGTADSYLTTNGLTGSLENVSGVASIVGPAGGNISINSTDAYFHNYKFSDFFKFSGHGLGGDIGFVYEYRPGNDYSSYTNERWANKYKFKLGISLLDVGSVHFNKSSNLAANYRVDIPGAEDFNLSSLKNKSVNQFIDVFNASPYFIKGSPQSSSYTVNLPTTLQVSADYLINENWGVNFSGQFNVNQQKNFNLYYFNSYNLTPRWENSLVSVELPLNYNPLTEFNAGLALRVGPFFIGSGSVITALFKNTRQADLHLGLHMGIQFKKKHKPDEDGDGVYDEDDHCPTVPGTARYRGCPVPDTDGDGINDDVDSCKYTAGIPRYKGCPMPDMDHDGVSDEEDSCIDMPGLLQFHGCPDTDGDGIPDAKDKCPIVYGTAKYQGCPVPDTDSDGVNDEVDLCPAVAGPASTHGCPVDQVLVQITADFKNILFNNGKASLRPGSTQILIRAADVMNEQIPNSSFYVDGYTDNVGKPAANKALSQARAQAVVESLVNFGVKRDRLIARGFGNDSPKCENTTEEGRQCNRRVEVVIRNINQSGKKSVIPVK